MAWDATSYLRFGGERTRPAADLLARVALEAPARVIDLGCGPGNSTALLAARWPGAAIEGLDSSEAMLAEAARSGARARWTRGDIAAWAPAARYDVVFSNAALQWLPDHEDLVPRLMAAVAPGGSLAIQVPRNMDAPSHALMRETAADGPWADRLRGVREVQVLAPADYWGLLRPLARSVDVWEAEYLHALDGEDAVYAWVAGTGLRPFLDRLGGAEREGFAAAYKERLARAYPRRADGATLFPFRRLFVVARARARA
jgi:trans-aconitate 2-methyltransferase